MAKEYCYYIAGENIAILEYDTENGWWDTPSTAVTNGFMLEYTKTITDPSTYSSSISINRELANAIVNYVKFRIREDSDPRAAQYYYSKFLQGVRKDANRKIAGVRQVMPRGTGMLK